MSRRTIDDMSRAELVKVLDKEFSMCVRMGEADDNGYVCCPTCGKIHLWNSGEIHCSHFVNRDRFAVRWDERNVIAQCRSENSYQGGNIWKMRDVLVERHGEDAVRQVVALGKTKAKPDVFWLREKIGEYRARNKVLKKEKGL